MAIRDTRTIRVKNAFIVEVLDKIIEQERERGNDDCGYPKASNILLTRINNVGGLR